MKIILRSEKYSALPKSGALFCISKTPGSAGGSKKLIAISLENKTPFDYTKIAAANCNESQKEVITT